MQNNYPFNNNNNNSSNNCYTLGDISENEWCNVNLNMQQPPMRTAKWIHHKNKNQQLLPQQQQQLQQQQQQQQLYHVNQNNNIVQMQTIMPQTMQQNPQEHQYQKYDQYQQMQNDSFIIDQIATTPPTTTTTASTNTLNNCYRTQQLYRQYNQEMQHLQQMQQQEEMQQVHTPPPILHSPYSPVSQQLSPLQLQSQSQQQQQQQQQQQHHHHHLQQIQAHSLAMHLQQQPERLLVSVDGIQSGVPTLTTSTLTPTTLRNIEETFVQLTNEPINFPNQAGFKPPPLATFGSVTQPTLGFNNLSEYNEQHETASDESQLSFNGQYNEESSQATTDNSSAATDTTSLQNGLNGMGNNSLTATSTTSSTTNDFTAVNIVIAAQGSAKNSNIFGTSTPNSTLKNSNSETTGTRSSGSGRRGGGRRPTQAANVSPEEEEKRRLRRERNKMAAARCRKRRVDQTNELLDEVAVLEKKRETFQDEIKLLTKTREDLEYVLHSHRPVCQKLRHILLNDNTFSNLITPTTTVTGANAAITGIDTTLASTGRISPIDLKPDLHDSILQHIKNEPLDSALDSSSLDDNNGPPSPKRLLPHVAELQASIAASLHTPIVTTAPVSFSNYSANSTLNALNKTPMTKPIRPSTLSMSRSLAQNLSTHVDGKPPTEIHGVPIQTPSTGMFNFESLMNGGTGLTPVSGPLVPTCSSQNKHPLELPTPTSEPSKLVSL